MSTLGHAVLGAYGAMLLILMLAFSAAAIGWAYYFLRGMRDDYNEARKR